MRRACAVAAMSFAVAAAAVADERVAFLAYSDGYWQVWVMRPDGTDLRQVTHSAREKARVSWYPDARHLLVTEMSARLVKVETNGGKEVAIGASLVGTQDAAVSPSGDWIAVAANTSGEKDSH